MSENIIRISGKKKNQLPEYVLGGMSPKEWDIYEKSARKNVIKEGEGHSTQYKYDFEQCLQGLKDVVEMRAVLVC